MFKKQKTKCYDDIIAIHLLLLQYVTYLPMIQKNFVQLLWNTCVRNEFLQQSFSCLRLIYKTVFLYESRQLGKSGANPNCVIS